MSLTLPSVCSQVDVIGQALVKEVVHRTERVRAWCAELALAKVIRIRQMQVNDKVQRALSPCIEVSSTMRL